MPHRPSCACKLTRFDKAAIQKLVNVATAPVPCDSGSGNCRLLNAVIRAIPTLNRILARQQDRL